MARIGFPAKTFGEVSPALVFAGFVRGQFHPPTPFFFLPDLTADSGMSEGCLRSSPTSKKASIEGCAGIFDGCKLCCVIRATRRAFLCFRKLHLKTECRHFCKSCWAPRTCGSFLQQQCPAQARRHSPDFLLRLTAVELSATASQRSPRAMQLAQFELSSNQ